jgi:hypothetical protein
MKLFHMSILIVPLVTGAGCHKMVSVPTEEDSDTPEEEPDRDKEDPGADKTDTGRPDCREDDSRCSGETVQLCVQGAWRDYSDCEIMDRECTVVEGSATCVPLPEETDTGTEIPPEKEIETDMGPAAVVFCNTDTMEGEPYDVRMIMAGDTTETLFEATSYCCTECLEVDSGEAVHYEVYYQDTLLTYGDLSLEGGREYIIVTLPDPLDPMIGILDLTKNDQNCATYIPSQHTRCGEEVEGSEAPDTATVVPDTDSADGGADAGASG